MNHFFISWAGNKRAEFKHIEKYVIDNGVEVIVEPFCGSGAFSYYMSKKYPKKFKYILNDNDKDLIELYNICKDSTKRDRVSKELNDEIEKIKDKVAYNSLTGWNKWFIHHKKYAIRAGLYPMNKPMNADIDLGKVDMCKFLDNENVEIRFGDGVGVCKEFMGNEKAFLFVDPPYIDTCNDFYMDRSGLNVYEWFYNNDMMNFKCKVMLVLEDNWIIRLLFKGNVKGTYGKKYQPSKKDTNHLVICNY